MGDGGDGDHFSYSLYLWDFDYYHDRLLREKYDTNHELIAEYFPTEITIRGILKAFETIFSLSIAPVEVTKEQIWHSDVRVFSVRDEQSAFLGYLYLDIYPREGKYNHAANFNIYPVLLLLRGKTEVAGCHRIGMKCLTTIVREAGSSTAPRINYDFP
ncbi:hypothetical protein N7536_000016 [Penicillium majusculum]|nr:hypothetical protein N7536_000016 [Penicillium majusculum]